MKGKVILLLTASAFLLVPYTAGVYSYAKPGLGVRCDNFNLSTKTFSEKLTVWDSHDKPIVNSAVDWYVRYLSSDLNTTNTIELSSTGAAGSFNVLYIDAKTDHNGSAMIKVSSLLPVSTWTVYGYMERFYVVWNYQC